MEVLINKWNMFELSPTETSIDALYPGNYLEAMLRKGMVTNLPIIGHDRGIAYTQFRFKDKTARKLGFRHLPLDLRIFVAPREK